MYIGHTSEDGRLQPLIEHLQSVGELSGDYAKVFGAEEIAKFIGLCHDLGKYSQAFQDRLLKNGKKVDHSTAGGKELADRIGPTFSYAILGHHSGLPNGGSEHDIGEDSSMRGRLKKTKIEDYSNYTEEIMLTPPQEFKFLPLNRGFSVSFLIRMLFSCLVDADFIDTERFMKGEKNIREELCYDSIDKLLETLMKYLEKFKIPKNEINRKRNEIMQDCLRKSQNSPGLYSLTVPTGGGKTLASLAFALNHAQKHGMKRIIYVIPYTSIIEQNANVFAKILGSNNVLEHHSNSDYDNNDDQLKKHLASENWDAPIVVTTNVQFFESFFASRTSKCRKLHNVANSVIIFDEAQMLPVNYLLPCVGVISELVYTYRCTAVLCSATQPALDQFFPKEIDREEICTNPKELYEFFRRTTIKNLEELGDEELVSRLRDHEQVLCIVNTRKQAQNLYEQLEAENCFHLSTLMVPKHRKLVLEEIRDRLNKGLICRVISTSLIEAGVDLDFPTVYRAQTGLDSIIQAAGRCNREGKRRADEGLVYIFSPDKKYTVPISQRRSGEIFNDIAFRYPDISSLEAIEEYFNMMYKITGDGLDEKKIMKQFEEGLITCSYPFATVSDEFKLIPDSTYTVLVPYDEEGKQIIEELRLGIRNRRLLRRAGQYSVNIYENHYRELLSMGIIERLDEALSILSETGSYNENTGLTLSPEGGKALFYES